MDATEPPRAKAMADETPKPQVRPFDLAALLSRADPFLRAMVDSLTEGVLVNGADLSVLAGNRAAERILGLSVAELLDRGATNLAWDFINADGAPLRFSESPMVVALEQARPVRGMQVGLIRGDGQRVWLTVSSIPLLSAADGKPFAVVTTFTDVSQQRETLEALRESERRLRLALSAARMTVWEWSPAQERARWQVARPNAKDSEGSGGTQDVFGMIHEGDRERVREEFRAVLRGEAKSDPFEWEMRVVPPDPNREMYWARVTGRAERDASGKVTKLSGTLADVNHRHVLEAELHQARRMESIGRLAGGIAHDFNNLLAVMMAAIESARSSASLEGTLPEELAAAAESAERARQLTRQLFAFARRQPVLLSELDVNELLRDLQRLLKQLLGACELSMQLEPSIWRVSADPTQLERVVLNLAANARDAMPDGGRFSLSTQNVNVTSHSGRALSAGRYICIVARDTGMGMGESVRERLFEPFFTTKADGNGLGLASSYGLIRQLGGDITVESAPGQGTTFHVFLPAAAAPGAAP